MNPADMIANFIKLRDRIAEMEKQHEEKLKPFKELRNRLEGMILDHLNQSGLDNIKSDAGTAFRSVLTSAKVDDWGVALDYIRSYELWDLLEARVNKTAVLSIIEETGRTIPGVTVGQIARLNVRRG